MDPASSTPLPTITAEGAKLGYRRAQAGVTTRGRVGDREAKRELVKRLERLGYRVSLESIEPAPEPAVVQ